MTERDLIPANVIDSPRSKSTLQNYSNVHVSPPQTTVRRASKEAGRVTMKMKNQDIFSFLLFPPDNEPVPKVSRTSLHYSTNNPDNANEQASHVNQGLHKNHGSSSLLAPARMRQMGSVSQTSIHQGAGDGEDAMQRLKERRKFFEGTSRQKAVGGGDNLIIKRIERAPASVLGGAESTS